MTILILGLILFLGTHALSIARGQRAVLVARFGEGGFKGLYSLGSLLGLVLIIWGYGSYRASGYIPVWNPPSGRAISRCWSCCRRCRCSSRPTPRVM